MKILAQETINNKLTVVAILLMFWVIGSYAWWVSTNLDPSEMRIYHRGAVYLPGLCAILTLLAARSGFFRMARLESDREGLQLKDRFPGAKLRWNSIKSISSAVAERRGPGRVERIYISTQAGKEYEVAPRTFGVSTAGLLEVLNGERQKW